MKVLSYLCLALSLVSSLGDLRKTKVGKILKEMINFINKLYNFINKLYNFINKLYNFINKLYSKHCTAGCWWGFYTAQYANCDTDQKCDLNVARTLTRLL